MSVSDELEVFEHFELAQQNAAPVAPPSVSPILWDDDSFSAILWDDDADPTAIVWDN